LISINFAANVSIRRTAIWLSMEGLEMNQKSGNVHPESSPSAPHPGGTGADGSGFGERLARIEAKMEHAATREDIQKLRVWVLGGVLGAVGIALVASAGVARLLA